MNDAMIPSPVPPDEPLGRMKYTPLVLRTPFTPFPSPAQTASPVSTQSETEASSAAIAGSAPSPWASSASPSPSPSSSSHCRRIVTNFRNPSTFPLFHISTGRRVSRFEAHLVAMASTTAPSLHSSASWTAPSVRSLRAHGTGALERALFRVTHWRTSYIVGCRAVMSAENRESSFASPKLEREGDLSHSGGEQSRRVGRGSRLVGSGSAVPKMLITNDELSKFVDTSDEWISVRTGIRNRRVLGEEETVTSLSVEASRKALEMANVNPEEVDLLLLCTSTPDDLFGSAPQVQKLLGCHNALAFDLTAACSGFVLGLVTATRFIRGGGYKNVLVVGADALSRYVDWTDRGTCILFGDASGALLLQAATDDQDSLLGFDLRSDGNGHKHLHVNVDNVEDSSCSSVESNGSAFKLPGKASYEYLQMNGKEVFKFAVRAVPQVVEGALQEAGLTSENLDWLLLHQANQRILDSVSDRLHIPSEKVISNLANYGNTSAASIPLALDEAVRSGKVKAGDVVATAGFGAGLTWGSAIVRWG